MKKIFLLVVFLFWVNSAFSQQLSITQNLSFGAFAPTGSISTVKINPDGSRIISGGAIPIGSFNYFPVILTYTSSKTSKYRNVHILYDTNINLSYNGHNMAVTIGPTNQLNDTYTTLPNQSTEIRIGGTLTINSITLNPPGNYTGSFNITIVQQ